MRILHLDTGREMRGGQWQVLRLIEGLALDGVQSTLLARKDAPLYAAARRQGWRLEKRKAPADLEAALRDAGIVVYLTDSEGLGSGALLAMSAGLPVVASNVGGLPEAIRHRENGLLVSGEGEVEAALREMREDRE